MMTGGDAHRAHFATHHYAALSGLLAPRDLHDMRLYHRQLLASGRMRFGDGQSARRFVAYNDPAARSLQDMLMPLMEQVAGVRVKPSYTYTAIYVAGAELPKHIDREQCEFSVSVALDFEPEPSGPTLWPLCLESGGRVVRVFQSLGDGLFYRGRLLPHFRSPLPAGCRSTSVFLHYVDAHFTGPLQ